MKVERVDKVTVYKRGETYCLYYRENGRTERRRVDGNLAVARLTAREVSIAISTGR